jgi:glycosyltransferase involved in cell wall biosynthesis
MERLTRHKMPHVSVRWRSSLPIVILSLANRLLSQPSSPRSADLLGRLAGRVAAARGGVLLSYSTYGYTAFPLARRAGIPCVLFQMHPHATTAVGIVERVTGDKRGVDRNSEWEYRLNEQQYEALVNEWRYADRIIAASSFTKQSLVVAGAAPDLIDVIPYGAAATEKTASNGPRPGLPVALFVGSFVRRKGPLDLAALALTLKGEWKFVAIGRGQVEDAVLRAFYASGIEVVLDASEMELRRRRAEADIFVFPSYLEGFGLVITEAMGAGLPVLTTTHTCGPDLIRQGVDGFVLEPGDVAGFALVLRGLAADRPRLAAMSISVRQQIKKFTWERFRGGVASTTERFAATPRQEQL